MRGIVFASMLTERRKVLSCPNEEHESTDSIPRIYLCFRDVTDISSLALEMVIDFLFLLPWIVLLLDKNAPAEFDIIYQFIDRLDIWLYIFDAGFRLLSPSLECYFIRTSRAFDTIIRTINLCAAAATSFADPAPWLNVIKVIGMFRMMVNLALLGKQQIKLGTETVAKKFDDLVQIRFVKKHRKLYQDISFLRKEKRMAKGVKWARGRFPIVNSAPVWRKSTRIFAR